VLWSDPVSRDHRSEGRANVEMTPRRMGTLAFFAFGGAGLVMITGAVALVVLEGEFVGAAALGAFGLVFGGVGFQARRLLAPPGEKDVPVAARAGDTTSGATYVSVDEDVPAAEVEAQQRRWAEEPWTQRGDWAEGKVVQEGAGQSGMLIGFAIVWNVFSWGFLALWAAGEPAWPRVLLLFPAVGVAIAVLAVRARIREKKFGTSVVECRTMPAWLGERFEGTVETGVPLRGRGEKAFTVRLRCVRRSSRTVRGSDGRGETRVSEETLWEHEETVRGAVAAKGPTFQVRLELRIPDGLPATELVPDDDRPLWRLQLRAEDEGVDYAADFEIPVYARRADGGEAGAEPVSGGAVTG
jgi:hypothetical protein